MKLTISFTNFGPYHLARLRALAQLLTARGGSLVAIETAGVERRYPWQPARCHEPFAWITLFPDHALEALPRSACARAMRRMLDQVRPDAVAVSGYVRPEVLAALGWAERRRRPCVLMSESQAIDHPRTWWKEAIKCRRVRRFDAALVGGPSHAAYLVDLGLPANRIALGYNAVDVAWYAHHAAEAKRSRRGQPARPYFLTVSRFAPEKNLSRLVRAFTAYRSSAQQPAWDLVLCGGGPGAGEVERAVKASGLGHAIHRPGFLQAPELVRWYAHAGAFVLPSLSEPWGLVVNEGAACGLPLLISRRAGCAETLVPDPAGTTGRQFDPENESDLTAALAWLAETSPSERAEMGRRAAALAVQWGPDRFAEGALEAVELAIRARRDASVRRSTHALTAAHEGGER